MNTNIDATEQIQINSELKISNEETIENNTTFQTHYLSQGRLTNLTHKNTPHLHQELTACFVTFRLKDSIPEEKYKKYFATINNNIKHGNFTGTEFDFLSFDSNRYEQKFLDMGHGNCILKNPYIKDIVRDSLMHFDGIKYDIHSFVIMPNHVHILFSCREGFNIQNIIRAWKSFTAFTINKRNKTRGSIWDNKFWDRLIRNEQHYVNVLKYIKSNNPKNSWVRPDIYEKYLKEYDKAACE